MNRGFNAKDREAALKYMNRAFRCPDGLVRWVREISHRGHFRLLWLDEASGHWHSGGTVHWQVWDEQSPTFQEVPSLPKGTPFFYAGMCGTITEREA